MTLRQNSLALGFLLLVPSIGMTDHKVGSLHLEQTEIWQECCHDRDCVPQTVEMASMGGGMVSVKIDGYPAIVQIKKFHPVPSDKTWVCYVDTSEPPMDINIRCILYPQGGNRN